MADAGRHGLADEANMLGGGPEAVGAQTDAGDVDAGESEGGHRSKTRRSRLHRAGSPGLMWRRREAKSIPAKSVAAQAARTTTGRACS